MSIAARTDSAELRSAIYERLRRRNRLVAILRIGLPVLGAIILAGLLLRLYVGSLVPDFDFANITIDRDNLVVETPSYSGVGADGTVYTVSAETARASIGDTDLVRMTGASFALKQPSGARYEARAGKATMRLSSQLLTIEGPTQITGSNGLSGTVVDAEVEVGAERMRSAGGVRFIFQGGSTLEAENMTYDGKAQLWTFKRATVTLASTPGEYSFSLRPSVGPASENPPQ